MTDQTPRARTLREMKFAASLEPCPGCGRLDPGELELAGGGDRWTLSARCPQCDRPRAFTFSTEGDPFDGAHARLELGGPTPSQVIRPKQFLDELERVRPAIRADLHRLGPAAWHVSADANDRAITALHELLKFVPDGAPAIPDTALDEVAREDRVARPAHYSRAWLVRERDRLLALAERYALDAPRIWALEGR